MTMFYKHKPVMDMFYTELLQFLIVKNWVSACSDLLAFTPGVRCCVFEV